jgi:ribosomal-protein-serine acetyltransferase
MPRFPELVTTKRLVLRTWKTEDADALADAIAGSIDHLLPWMPWAAGEPVPIEDRRRLIDEWQRAPAAGGEVVYGVFLEGAVIGGCGLHQRVGPGALEIGYWIHADHIRRGYATELTAALTEVAFTIEGIERVEVHHDRANVASAGVPRALGYEFVTDRPDAITAPGEEGIDSTWVMTRARWAER